jgi:hypothetical protein
LRIRTITVRTPQYSQRIKRLVAGYSRIVQVRTDSSQNLAELRRSLPGAVRLALCGTSTTRLPPGYVANTPSTSRHVTEHRGNQPTTPDSRRTCQTRSELGRHHQAPGEHVRHQSNMADTSCIQSNAFEHVRIPGEHREQCRLRTVHIANTTTRTETVKTTATRTDSNSHRSESSGSHTPSQERKAFGIPPALGTTHSTPVQMRTNQGITLQAVASVPA